MKILQVVVGLHFGGAEKVVLDLCTQNEFDEEHEMEVLSLTNEVPRLYQFEDKNIPVTVWKMSKNPLALFKELGKLNRLIKQRKIDIVHCHLPHAAMLLSLYNIFYKKIPLLFTPHSINIEGKMREYFFFLFRNFRNTDILFDANHHQFYNTNSFEVIANGINVAEIFNIAKRQQKNECFTFLHVGRLNIAKNQKLLINEFAKFASKHKNVRLNIVGTGELRKDLQNLVNSKKLSDKVFFLGHRTDIAELLGQSHVFVLSSKWEGLPISILEAGAAGIPILSTPVGSIPVVLSDLGTLSNENELSNGMRDVLVHWDDKYKNALQLQKQIHQKFDISGVYNAHIRLYKNTALSL